MDYCRLFRIFYQYRRNYSRFRIFLHELFSSLRIETSKLGTYLLYIIIFIALHPVFICILLKVLYFYLFHFIDNLFSLTRWGFSIYFIFYISSFSLLLILFAQFWALYFLFYVFIYSLYNSSLTSRNIKWIFPQNSMIIEYRSIWSYLFGQFLWSVFSLFKLYFSP